MRAKACTKASRIPTRTTAIDLNRTGVPLIEIVSEPDIASPDEAYEYLTRLKEIILYTGVSDCNMEEGSLRCDANVSIRPRGQKEFGTKTEVKNVNSFRFIREALEYEIERQIGVIESGGKITQETRLYNANEGKTYGMRSKEQAHDYRYFPEPDLLPLVVDENGKPRFARPCPNFRKPRRKRMVADYGITEHDAQVLTISKSPGRPIRSSRQGRQESQACRESGTGRIDGTAEGQRSGNRAVADLDERRRRVSRSGGERHDLREDAERSLRPGFERGKDFSAIYEEQGRPQQSSDTSALEKIIDEVIAANPKQVEQYRGGKEDDAGFFVGQVMKASKGQANPQLVNDLLAKKLEG